MSKLFIDYCVIVFGDIKPFVELHFRSFIKEGGSFGQFSSFHVVDKETKDGTMDFCKKFIPSVNIHPLGFYYPKNRTGQAVSSSWQWDLAFSYDYAISNCGTSEWIYIVHPDTVYFNTGAFFEGIIKMVTPEVGAIYDGGTLLLRKYVYKQLHLGLWPLFGVVFYEKPEQPEYGYLRGYLDKTIPKDAKVWNIQGLEAWELCWIELQLLGWSTLVIPYEISQHKEHTGHCTGHDIDDLTQSKIYQDKWKLVNNRLKGYK